MSNIPVGNAYYLIASYVDESDTDDYYDMLRLPEELLIRLFSDLYPSFSALLSLCSVAKGYHVFKERALLSFHIRAVEFATSMFHLAVIDKYGARRAAVLEALCVRGCVVRSPEMRHLFAHLYSPDLPSHFFSSLSLEVHLYDHMMPFCYYRDPLQVRYLVARACDELSLSSDELWDALYEHLIVDGRPDDRAVSFFSWYLTRVPVIAGKPLARTVGPFGFAPDFRSSLELQLLLCMFFGGKDMDPEDRSWFQQDNAIQSVKDSTYPITRDLSDRLFYQLISSKVGVLNC